jgi:aminoglycoside phosphotransferase (APT) family kinase protein
MGVASGDRVSQAETFDEILAGGLSHRAVRRVVRDPMRHGLADILDVQLPDRRRSNLELLRTKYKPARKLTAYYRLVPGQASSDGDGGIPHLAVSWFTQPSRIEVLVAPADPAMPQLERLARPAHLAGVLDALTGNRGGAASSDQMDIGTIRYRPGQRHVLIARQSEGPGVYVKTDRDDSGALAVPVAAFLADLLAGRCRGAQVAEPVGYFAADSAALWWSAEGESLSRLLADRTRATAAARSVAEVGRVLRALQECPSVAGPDPALGLLGSRDAAAEAASTLRAGEHITALLPSLGATYEVLVSAVRDSLDRLPVEAATFGHGDFKSDNLLVHDRQLRILDLDRSCWAEPALDLGKFLADLRWWCPSGSDAAALSQAFRAGYGPCPPVRWARAELLGALFQLKLAARRCQVHDDRWETQVRSRVADAAATLRLVRGAS